MKHETIKRFEALATKRNVTWFTVLWILSISLLLMAETDLFTHMPTPKFSMLNVMALFNTIFLVRLWAIYINKKREN